MYELKENALTIFKNEKKSETHPDWKGKINVEGKLYDIALWEKEGAKGMFFSGKVSEPWTKPEAAEPPTGIYEKTGRLEIPPKIEDQQKEQDLPF